MNNREYWQKRGELTQNRLMQYADDFIPELETAYQEAIDSIQKDIDAFFQRFAVNEKLTLSEAKRMLKTGEIEKFRMTLKEYIRKGKENGVSQKWMKELESASSLYRMRRLEALQIQIRQRIELLAAYKQAGTKAALGKILEEGYYRNVFDVQQFMGEGSAFATLDTRKINAALAKPWTYDGETFSTRIWKNTEKLQYSLEKILTQGIIRGDSPDRIAKSIAKEAGVELSSARRLVLTESSAMSTQASMLSYEELGVEEIEFLASLDEKTCDECGGMDGRHFPRKEGQIGLNLSPLHPCCRCTTVPYFDDEFTVGEERAARGEDGKTYYVPADMTYEEWKASHVLTEKEEGAILKYISPAAYVLNGKLREGITLTDEEEEWTKILDNALDKMPVYRGFVSRSVDLQGDEMKEFLNIHKKGERVIYPAYTSFTKEGIYNDTAKVQLYVKSKKGVDISGFNKSEQEILYKRDTVFRVQKIEKRDGMIFIQLEEE